MNFNGTLTISMKVANGSRMKLEVVIGVGVDRNRNRQCSTDFVRKFESMLDSANKYNIDRGSLDLSRFWHVYAPPVCTICLLL